MMTMLTTDMAFLIKMHHFCLPFYDLSWEQERIWIEGLTGSRCYMHTRSKQREIRLSDAFGSTKSNAFFITKEVISWNSQKWIQQIQSQLDDLNVSASARVNPNMINSLAYAIYLLFRNWNRTFFFVFLSSKSQHRKCW